MDFKHKPVSYIEVDSNELLAYLKKCYQGDSPDLALLEASNDTDYAFSDLMEHCNYIGDNFPNYVHKDMENMRDAMRSGEIEYWKLRKALQIAIIDGFLDPENYLVTVSW